MAQRIIQKRLAHIINSRHTFGKGYYCRNRECTAEHAFIPEMNHKNIHQMAQILNKKGCARTRNP